MSDRIQYVNKSTLNPSGVPENNKWSGPNAQEVKDVVNAHADDIEDLQQQSVLFLEAKLVLSQVQIQSLNTTPIEIIPAPGVNKYIHLDTCYFYLDHNGTSYATATFIQVEQVSTGVGIFVGPIIVKTANTFTTMRRGGIFDIKENEAFVIKADADSPESGGIITVELTYQIKDFN